MLKTNRIIILGFDGLSPTVIKNLADNGQVPTLKGLMNKGISGSLVSTVPPLSPPAWSSIITGYNPGKHGVYDFITEVKEDGRSDIKLHNSSSLRGITIWDILGKHNKNSIVLNVPLTYPPYKINGIMIPGFPSPVNELCGSPEETIRKYKKLYPEYKIDIGHKKPKFSGMTPSDFFNEGLNLMDKRLELTLDLMSNYSWDLFFVVFTCSDRIQHVFWENDVNDVIKKLYIKVDSIVKLINKTMPDDAYVFVISDHGFEFVQYNFGINNWLQKNGFINGNKKSLNKYNRIKYIYRKINGYGLIDINKMFSLLPTKLKKSILKPEAISPFFGGITLDKDHHSQESIEKIKNMICLELTKLRDNKGDIIIDKIFYREELYSGKHLLNAPDIVLVPKSGYRLVKWTKNGDVAENIGDQSGFMEDKGIHQSWSARRGVLMIDGPEISPRSCDMKVTDIVPTILNLLKLPVPREIDGRVHDILEHTPINYEKQLPHKIETRAIH